MLNKILLVVGLFAMGCHSPKPQHWVAIGDSITYLNDHLDETDFRLSKGYLTAVQDQLPHLKVTNKGYNGWTVVRIAEHFDELNMPKASLYTIFLGTNDWWAGNPLGTFLDYQKKTGVGTVLGAYRFIVDQLKTLNPEATIVLITPMQRVDFVYLNNYQNNAYGSYKPKKGQTLESFAQAIQKIGKEEGFPVLDLYHHPQLQHQDLVQFKRLKNSNTGVYENYSYPDYIGLPFDPKSDAYPYPLEAIGMTYDGLHPSDEGNQLIAKALVALLSEIK